MDLEQALHAVDAQCDVDLPTLKRLFREMAQQKFGERAARGLLMSNGTAAVVKDEFNRFLTEKAGHYLHQYSVVLPATDVADFDGLEARLRAHFRERMDFYYSEACHQLDTAKANLQINDGSLIHLEADYQNSLRGWEVDIKVRAAYLKKFQMSVHPNITYHFHGHNARVNTNSVDTSVNVVNLSEGQLFNDLRQLLEAIPDQKARALLIEEAGVLAAQKEKGSRVTGYLKFIEHASQHVTLLAPLLPALAQWAQQ